MSFDFTETLTIEVPDVEEKIAAFSENEYKRSHGLIIEVAAIRKSDPVGRYGKLHIDHCHATGKARGALCHNCNVGIGNFNDDIQRMKDAIAYLEREF